MLDDTPLPDPDTGLLQPSLRERCSQDGQLCYARVLLPLRSKGSTGPMSQPPRIWLDAERVMLTEAHLVYALAWDERLFWRTPAQIRRLMQAQAEELAPLSSCSEPEPPAALFPAPVEPLTVVTTVEVTPEELREAFESSRSPPTLQMRPPTQA